jgi:hypothetical protein
VFFASSKVVCLTLVERRSRCDCSLTLRYARAGLEGLEGLAKSDGFLLDLGIYSSLFRYLANLVGSPVDLPSTNFPFVTQSSLKLFLC